MHVGGCFGRWEALMAGSTMAALGPTADHAPTDHLVQTNKNKCYQYASVILQLLFNLLAPYISMFFFFLKTIILLL
jgi:hypothetical protein